MFKKKLTEVAVDSFTEYLHERLDRLKQLDLDKDGRKDVDQIIEIVHKCGTAVKDLLDTTDFSKMAAGLENIVSGTAMIGTSFDREKVQTVGRELKCGATKLAALAQLGITEMKEHQKNDR